jgi:hypothetical protein
MFLETIYIWNALHYKYTKKITLIKNKIIYETSTNSYKLIINNKFK